VLTITGKHEDWRWRMLSSTMNNHREATSTQAQKARDDLSRAGPENYVRPCEMAPSLWDGVTKDDTYESALARASEAADRCLDCRVYVPCLRLAEAVKEERRPSVVGVLAGHLIDDSVTGIAVAEALATGASANEQKGSAA
jgi:hypothetical protein